MSAYNDGADDPCYLNVRGIENCVPRSAYASIFDVASPSIARFPGTLFLSWPPLLYLDERGRLRGTAYWPSFQSSYWPELDECTKLVCRGTPASRPCNDAGPQLKQALLQQSSKQPGRSVDVRVTEEMTTPEPHFGHSDNGTELYARNTVGYGKAQLHPSAVEQDKWKYLHAVHRSFVATAYGKGSVTRLSTAVMAVDGAPPVDVVEEGWPPSATTIVPTVVCCKKGALVGRYIGLSSHLPSLIVALQGLAQNEANFYLAAKAH